MLKLDLEKENKKLLRNIRKLKLELLLLKERNVNNFNYMFNRDYRDSGCSKCFWW